MVKRLVIFWILTIPAWAAQIPDGAWNGKLWERDRLLAGVEKGERDALAEWAYCCRRGLLQLPHDSQLIFQRASKAAEKGSIIGKRLVAKCVAHGEGTSPNPKRAFTLFSQLDCPGAWVDLASYHLRGKFVQKSEGKARELITKAYNKGSVRAIVAKADLESRYGAPGPNSQTPESLYLRAFRAVPDVFNAFNIYDLLVRDSIAEETRADILSSSKKVVEQGMKLNHPLAFLTQSHYELNAAGGDKHLGVELHVKAANLGNIGSTENITSWIRSGLRKKNDGAYQLFAIGYAKDYAAAVDMAFKRGSIDWAVRLSYATKLSRSGKGPRVANHKRSAQILKRLIFEGECDAHDVLGTQRIQEHVRYKGLKSDMDRGFAHLIYHSNHSSYSLYLLGLFYGDQVEVSHDPVRQAAVYKFSLSKFKGKKNDSNKEAVKKLAGLEKQLTPEQKEAVEKLVKAGFPAAKKFRKPAFDLLVKSGDLPKTWEFEE